MTKTANINVRIDPETKSSAEKLFSSFGITVTDAINIPVCREKSRQKNDMKTECCLPFGSDLF